MRPRVPRERGEGRFHTESCGCVSCDREVAYREKQAKTYIRKLVRRELKQEPVDES